MTLQIGNVSHSSEHSSKVPPAPSSEDVIETTHGQISLNSASHQLPLRQETPKRTAAGLPAVLNSFKYAWSEAGLIRGTLPMLQINQADGFDCPGCAWPDPDGHRSAFEFCENGIKAMSHESDRRRITAEFFAKYSVEELSQQSDYWLEQQGRLTAPVYLKPGASHYEPISWDAAFELIGKKLNSLKSPNEAVFYTSGKATNEAAFCFQLLARELGTNNLPDCSNMCHESSGTAMTKAFGFGKGTVTLEDFTKTELILVVGQNPGTNHPRQLTALQAAKRAGAKIISINPLPEAGLMSFMNPQEPLGLLGVGTQLTDLHLPVKVNGDLALFKGFLKYLVEADDREPGSGICWDYVRQYTTGSDELIASVRAVRWEEIEEGSGLSRKQIEEAAEWIRTHERMIICWCLGVTQHNNGTQTVQEMMNLIMLRGSIAKQGCGPCCVRGHSNVQGDRTMGVWERPRPELLDRLEKAFQFSPPRDPGFDSQETVIAMHENRVRVFISLGGNFLMALSDTRFTASALTNVDLIVRIGTKLNRSDLVVGKEAIILPCLGRTERDQRPGSNGSPPTLQITSTENSMGIVQGSVGRFEPVSPYLKGEVEILCRIAHATFGDREHVDWLAWADNYDLIRDAIAKVIPGFENFNEDVRKPRGFYLPNPPRQNIYPTPTGKATFTINPLPEFVLEPGQLVLTTLRSHDQFNTTIYGLHDRYRGIFNNRRIIMMNREDLRERGLTSNQSVDITSHHAGQTRTVRDFIAVEYPIPRRCAAMYFPEGNALIPISSNDNLSNCPSFKSVAITVTPSRN